MMFPKRDESTTMSMALMVGRLEEQVSQLRTEVRALTETVKVMDRNTQAVTMANPIPDGVLSTIRHLAGRDNALQQYLTLETKRLMSERPAITEQEVCAYLVRGNNIPTQ